ncbi:hypothetical protein BDA96_07G133900 [Sorghum bicolor]|uniref:RRM domain-containing protein n=1 Tax=Sorghum bicolor TaxID=4558 RepID=A0A921U9N0_SORBI|nr:hypothetical protein BDA96_07G133900 [Sorghum bicolor]
MGMRDKKWNQKLVLARRRGQVLPEPENTAKVVYIGHIPHGFYEDEKQGKSKHYGFIEFESPVVSKIVADEMNNYLLFEHTLQVSLVLPEKVHPKLWKGVRHGFIPIDRVAIEQMRHNKDEKRRKRIKAAGIDYECPALVSKPCVAAFSLFNVIS